jgi:gag-polypeptide of LTR copia-type
MASPTTLLVSQMRSDTPIQFSHQIHTILTNDNYLIWKSQIILVLRGYNLMHFIDGTYPPPSILITSDGSSSANLDFQKWQQHDQLILAWIFNSMSQSILAQVIHCESACQL